MTIDRERLILSLNPSKITGAQLTAILTAVVQAVPDAEWEADGYNGLTVSRPDVVPAGVPAEWIEP